MDMPELMHAVSAKLGPPAIYPLREYWLDIGRLDDLKTAQEQIAGFLIIERWVQTSMTRRLCTICARGGSKGLPLKNVRLLMGRPLISH